MTTADFTLDDELKLFCQTVDLEQARRDEELFAFLEELINSQEFRKTPSKRDAATQVLPRYLEKYAKETKELIQDLATDFSLAKYFQKRHNEDKMLRIREEFEENKKIRACQRDAIAIIKEHINRVAQHHAASMKEKAKTRLQKIENILEVVDMRPEFKQNIVEHVISIKKLRRNQIIGRKQRELAIVKKLLTEKKRWKQIQEIQNKTYDYKVERRQTKERSVENLKEPSPLNIAVLKDLEDNKDIEGNIPSYQEVKEEGTEKTKAQLETIEEAVESGKEKKKDKNGKKKNKGKQVQMDKRKKDKKETAKKREKDKKVKGSDKKGKNGKKKKHEVDEIPDLAVPEAPITNPRRKIRVNEPIFMNEILKQHEELLMVIDERRHLEELLRDEKSSYERDDTCIWRPNPVVFDEFFNGEIYKKKVTIVNGGKLSKKIKLHAAIIDDGFDPYLIEVDNFGFCFLIPGFSAKLTVTFRPRKLDRVTYGKLTFLSCDNGANNPKQFTIPIKCIPEIEKVTITPHHLKFGTIRYWQVKDLKPKRLRVISTNSKTYRVGIKKILEETQIAEIADVLSSRSLQDIEKILDDITDICFHHFRFARYYLELPSNSGFEVKVTPRGLDRVGSFFERFECQLFEEQGDQVVYVGCQECIASLEIMDHFVRIEPDIIDFGVCCFGSVYQAKFSLMNADTTSHRVLLQFPSGLKPYLISNLAESVLSIGDQKEITLKFTPREEMVDGFLSFYEPETKILKFPIKAQVTTKEFNDCPPVKLTVFAILTESLGLILKPLALDHASINGGDILLNIGTCMTREAIVAKIGITNISITRQHFGFLDLPMCISIAPNYGFGVLDPYESKELILTFNPEIKDMEGCGLEGQQSIMSFRISVTSLKHAGAIKKTLNYRSLRRLFQQVVEELRNPSNNDLARKMSDAIETLRNSDDLNVSTSTLIADNTEYPIRTDESSAGTEMSILRSEPRNVQTVGAQMPHILENINSNKMWLLATVVDLPFSLSHQYVAFPNTPCGSFSIMSVRLKTSKSINQMEDFQNSEVHFDITGDNSQIIIEPISRDIKGKTSVDLYLIARPNVPDDVIEQKARYLKKLEIIEMKRQQILQKREQEKQAKLLRELKALEKKRAQELLKKSKKDKKDKKGKKSEKFAIDSQPTRLEDEQRRKMSISNHEEEKEPLPEITVEPEEIQINYCDLYPAEMIIWRDYEPKTIEANFTIRISYPNTPKESEYLYLKASCKVVSPSFIHNLDRQHIDFGPIVLGGSKCQILELRNIKDVTITPKTSLLSPLGIFTCPSLVNVMVPSEHVLKLPITFKPVDTSEILGQEMNIMCHCCFGERKTICFDDPESARWLTCDNSTASTEYVPEDLEGFVDQVLSNKSHCMRVKYSEDGENYVLRSCIPDYPKICEKMNLAGELMNVTINSCDICSVDLCNFTVKLSNNGIGVVFLMVLLSILV